MYVPFYFDESGEKHLIGEVKIGQFGIDDKQRRPSIPPEFGNLGRDVFFSLGQDNKYYENLNQLGEEIRRTNPAGSPSICDRCGLRQFADLDNRRRGCRRTTFSAPGLGRLRKFLRGFGSARRARFARELRSPVKAGRVEKP